MSDPGNLVEPGPPEPAIHDPRLQLLVAGLGKELAVVESLLKQSKVYAGWRLTDTDLTDLDSALTAARTSLEIVTDQLALVPAGDTDAQAVQSAVEDVSRALARQLDGLRAANRSHTDFLLYGWTAARQHGAHLRAVLSALQSLKDDCLAIMAQFSVEDGAE